MKYLIVNGDDFGASPGITRGILEAHQRGILTSTSLMVDMPASGAAARLGRDLPRLSVGLHIDLADRSGGPFVAWAEPARCRAELHRQFVRFQELMGRLPSQLDAHHNAHRDPRLLPAFLELARQHQLPLRGYSPVRYFAEFYGQWDGVTHLEQVSVESLVRMLETEIGEGCTELGCHPGYADPDWSSGYSREREAELWTLCDPRVRAAVEEQQIQLINFHDFPHLSPREWGRGDGDGCLGT
jgi:chitin disaccharide deacetylase